MQINISLHESLIVLAFYITLCYRHLLYSMEWFEHKNAHLVNNVQSWNFTSEILCFTSSNIIYHKIEQKYMLGIFWLICKGSFVFPGVVLQFWDTLSQIYTLSEVHSLSEFNFIDGNMLMYAALVWKYVSALVYQG